ncbi:MAG: hypothetical protein Kow0068_03230 [Marinilabiliales bacterium]
MLIFSACSTDFDVNADWKDITVVYGLLDAKDTANYVKINKCFLGDASAYDMAAISDSSIYDSISVVIKSGKINSAGVFEEDGGYIFPYPTTEIDKDPGIFANDNNVLYKFTNPLDINKDYKIEIAVPGKSELVTAQTKLLNTDYIYNSWTRQSLNLYEDNSSELSWKSVEYGKVYEVVVRFHYIEVNQDNTREYKTIEWSQPAVTTKTTQQGEEIIIALSGNSFLGYVSNKIKNASDYNPDVVMRVVEKTNDAGKLTDKVEILIYVGSEDLYTFMEVSAPSNTINQEKPSFTNISNGIGLFTSRSYVEINNEELLKIKISDKTIDALANSDITSDLKFEDAGGTVSYWLSNP